MERLKSIPGVGQLAAEVIVAEVGADMSPFPTAGHLVSWAGLCPGHNESAGKRKSGKTRKGDRWLRTVLNECALAAIRDRDSRLAARYRRIMRHRGHKKAIVAVANTILTISWHLLTSRTTYEELGENYFSQRDRDMRTRNLVHQLERLGHKVSIEPAA